MQKYLLVNLGTVSLKQSVAQNVNENPKTDFVEIISDR